MARDASRLVVCARRGDLVGCQGNVSTTATAVTSFAGYGKEPMNVFSFLFFLCIETFLLALESSRIEGPHKLGPSNNLESRTARAQKICAQAHGPPILEPFVRRALSFNECPAEN